MKVKLQVLEKEAQKKSAKRREDQAKQEKHQLKEREKDLRVKQRIEVSIKVMTLFEPHTGWERSKNLGKVVLKGGQQENVINGS